MSRISNGYTPPPDACLSYRTLYRALADFEADMHQHVHLENNILFPRAIEMERTLAQAPRAYPSRATRIARNGREAEILGVSESLRRPCHTAIVVFNRIPPEEERCIVKE